MIQIIDDFFPDPFFIRNVALKCKDFVSLPQYPGKRCKIPKEIQTLTLNLIEKNTNYRLKASKIDPEGMSFNFIDSSYCCGMPHSDHPVAKYSCIIFLSPNPPKLSGIEIYQKYEGREYNPKILKSNNIKETFFRSHRNMFQKLRYRYISTKTKNKQKDKIEIENKFNRMVLFDSNLLHNAQNYFGNTKQNSRLTLMSFLYPI